MVGLKALACWPECSGCGAHMQAILALFPNWQGYPKSAPRVFTLDGSQYQLQQPASAH